MPIGQLRRQYFWPPKRAFREFPRRMHSGLTVTLPHPHGSGGAALPRLIDIVIRIHLEASRQSTGRAHSLFTRGCVFF